MPNIEIKSFSPAVFKGVREFFASHPVVEMEVLRDANMGSKLVRVAGGVCEVCGYEWTAGPLFIQALQGELQNVGEEMPSGTLPSDFIKAIRLTHAWDQASRSVYCGGHLRLNVN